MVGSKISYLQTNAKLRLLLGGYGHGDSGGHHSGQYSNTMPYHKGLKYKHSSYEVTTYGDKGGHGNEGTHKGGAGHSDSHHNQKGIVGLPLQFSVSISYCWSVDCPVSL
jgi:hypothetical protein